MTAPVHIPTEIVNPATGSHAVTCSCGQHGGWARTPERARYLHDIHVRTGAGQLRAIERGRKR